MKVEQLNNVQIDWTKPQVVVSDGGTKIALCVNFASISDDTFSGLRLDTGSFRNDWKKSDFKQETATQYPIDLKLTIESEGELNGLLKRTPNILTAFCLAFEDCIHKENFYKHR